MIALLLIVAVFAFFIGSRIYVKSRLKPFFAWLDEESAHPADLSNRSKEELLVDFNRHSTLDRGWYTTARRRADPRYSALQAFGERVIARRDELTAQGVVWE